MSYNELNKINNMVTKAADALFLNEKFPVGALAFKASQIAQANPQDITCVGMYNFLNKYANKNYFITRGELRDVYNKLYTSSTKFNNFFGDELGVLKKEASHQKAALRRDARENHLVTELHKHISDFDNSAFEAWAEELGPALDKKAPVTYNSEMARIASKTCAHELNSVGMLPKKIEVVSKLDSYGFLCQASYETPKGIASVLVPVEKKDGMIIPPGYFVSQAGFEKINQENISDYIRSTAGKKYQANVAEVIKAFKEPKKECGEVEKIVRKLATKKGKRAFDTNSVLLKEIDPAHPELRLEAGDIPEEYKGVAERLESKRGAAEFIFGRDAVERGMNLIAFEVEKAGLGKPQVSIIDSEKNAVNYAVAINNRTGFKTKLKFNGKNPQLPKVIISEGKLYSFTNEGLQKLANETGVQSEILAQTSPMYDLKASELVDQVRKSVAEENFDRAADALHVLGQQDDKVAYRAAYDLFTAGLKGDFKKSASAGCKHASRRSTSQKLICSQTNLPVDKVYQDKHGNCRPLYRRGMEDSSTEGVSTLTSRIYFE